MKSSYYISKVSTRSQLLIGLIILLTLSVNHSLQAQIVPDTTLPSNSLVIPNGTNVVIDGGTQAGSNLFHSFSEFSVPTGSGAFFNNASTVENIISRVTGSAVSNIDGFIRANGSANLFLLNPNGIIFGPNASLNIGGSFLTSTANSLRFADGNEFNATNPSSSPLLTVTMPIGLQFRQDSGVIRVQGAGHNLELVEPLIFFSIKRGDSVTGLRVQPGNTLALVGGNIDIEGGTLTAEDGRIELGSVNSGLVSLHSTSVGWNLGYEGVESFQDIRLTQQALADASGVNSGSIQVQGTRVLVSDGSVILLENQGAQPGGSISVNASQSLELKAGVMDTFPTLLFTQATGQGKGGDIRVSTRQLIMRGGVNIDALTLGDGAKGGNISVYASDSIQLIGGALNDIIIARTQNSGAAGNIIVSTGKLTILNGSNILSASNLGTGDAGDVKVNAFEIELIGVGLEPFFLPSLISSVTRDGNASSVEINTSRLLLHNGGQVSTSTLSTGDAGSVTINASEFVEVSGTVPESVNSTQVISAANILDEGQQALFGLPPVPSGASGNVTINTPQLMIVDGAQVTVRNDGTGNAGNLLINTNSIFLDNKGGITASTADGEGGNITLNVQDTLQLSNNSFISATAGGTGNGGNIDINTKFLIAFPNGNSDITANAVEAEGGRVSITAQGIFGTDFRSEQTPESDITATSALGPEFNGTVELNTPEVDPSRGLVELPETVVDPNALIAQNPCKQGAESEFTVTGRGGLPPSLNEDLSSEAVQVGLVEPVSPSETEAQSQRASLDTSSIQNPKPPGRTESEQRKTQNPIVPAQGWVFSDEGEVVLTAYNPTVTGSQRQPTNPAICPAP